TVTTSESRPAFRFWITTVRRAPRSSRRTKPKRPGGPIATCLQPHHPLSPKVPPRANDGRVHPSGASKMVGSELGHDGRGKVIEQARGRAERCTIAVIPVKV